MSDGVTARERVTVPSASGISAEGSRTTPSARERFLAVLYNLPLLYGDAIVVFSGDGTARVEAAVESLRQRAAHYVVVSGGVDDPPHALTAQAMAKHFVGAGLARDRIIMEDQSQHTRDQAEALAALVQEHKWSRVLLCVSPYHMPRAFLTVVQSLEDAGLSEKVHVLPLMASHVGWFDKPEGLDVTRYDLLTDELRKIEEYRALYGHVASYEDGISYLKYWETRR